MGTTLTGTTPQDTYDSLIKVTDNGPLSGTAKYLSDGLGNDSALAVSTAAVGIGTNTPSEVLQVSKTQSATTRLQITNAQTGGSTAVRASLRVTANDRIGEFVAVNGDSVYIGAASNHATALMSNGAGVLHATPAGNVGIGESSPSTKLELLASATVNLTGNTYYSARFLQDKTNYRGVFFGYDTTGTIGVIGAETASPASALAFYTYSGSSWGERARITTNGLTFNGDTAAANALDDYEEGDWTPNVTFGNASTGITYGTRGGKYTKIGRQVSVTGYFIFTNKGTATGVARITGLPFTIGAEVGFYTAASFGALQGISYNGVFQGYGEVNTTRLTLNDYTEAGVQGDITDADFTNVSQILMQFTYFV